MYPVKQEQVAMKMNHQRIMTSWGRTPPLKQKQVSRESPEQTQQKRNKGQTQMSNVDPSLSVLAWQQQLCKVSTVTCSV